MKALYTLIILLIPFVVFGQEKVHVCDLNKYSSGGTYQEKLIINPPFHVHYQKFCKNYTIYLNPNFRLIDTLIVHNNSNWWKDDNNYFDGIIYDNFENGEPWWELEYNNGYISKYTEWFENKKKITVIMAEDIESAGEIIESIKFFTNGKETFEANKISGLITKNRLDNLQEIFFKRGFKSFYNLNRNRNYERKSSNYVKKPTPIQIVINDPIHPKRFLYIPSWAEKLTHKRYNKNTYSEIELDSINFLNQLSFLKRKQDSVRQLFKEKEFIKAYKKIEKGSKIKPKIKDAIALIDEYNNESEIISDELFHISIQLRTLKKNGCFIYKIDEHVYLDTTNNKFYFKENNREVPVSKYTISDEVAGDIAFNYYTLEDMPRYNTTRSTFFYQDIDIDSNMFTRNWYSENGFLEQQEGLSNDKKNGKQKRWHSNGQLEYEYNYVNGQKNGKQQRWGADNGILLQEENYFNDQQHGKQKYWNYKGQLTREENYVNGRLNGKQKYWHDNGKLDQEENYVNGQLHGKQIYWDYDGQLTREKNYVNGKQHGKQKYWHDTGKLQQEENYVNGQLHGKRKYWDYDGQLEEETNYVNGQQHGKQKYWDYNGQLTREENYVNDKQHGKQKQYHDNGKLQQDENYVNGQLHGKQKYWDYDGQLERETNYVNGQQHGKQKYWDWSGQLLEESNYVNGKEVYEDEGTYEYDDTYKEEKINTTSNNGTYTTSTEESSITINGSIWNGLIVIENEFGSQYNETFRDNGIVKGNDLYDELGLNKIGYISSTQSITTTIGGNTITLYKRNNY
tara:strand:+ start:1658 stop:4036 length:2379 start_codon:yes stop_codon:yes gene_type:complete